MLRELLALLRGTQLSPIGDEFGQMIELGHKATVRAGRIYFGSDVEHLSQMDTPLETKQWTPCKVRTTGQHGTGLRHGSRFMAQPPVPSLWTYGIP